MASDGKALLLAVLALVGGFAGGYYWGRSLAPFPGRDSTEGQKLLLAEAENQMLRRMLGEIPAQVVLLAPTEHGKAAYGKLVWDEAKQLGFLFMQDFPPLPEGEGYYLALGKDEKHAEYIRLRMPESGQGDSGKSWNRIEPARRILGARFFKVVQKAKADSKDEQVILLGF
jgi:hypothetical protein